MMFKKGDIVKLRNTKYNREVANCRPTTMAKLFVVIIPDIGSIYPPSKGEVLVACKSDTNHRYALYDEWVFPESALKRPRFHNKPEILTTHQIEFIEKDATEFYTKLRQREAKKEIRMYHIKPTVAVPKNHGFKDQSPFHDAIVVKFDHTNHDISDIHSLEQAIRAMYIEEEEEFSIYPVGSELWYDIQSGGVSADTLVSLFTNFANELVKLGELDADGEIIIDAEYAELLARYGVKLIEKETVTIYALPITATGLDADTDNCEYSDTIVELVDFADPLTPGCDYRYVTTDGYYYDMNIDPFDWADWIGTPLEAVSE